MIFGPKAPFTGLKILQFLIAGNARNPCKIKGSGAMRGFAPQFGPVSPLELPTIPSQIVNNKIRISLVPCGFFPTFASVNNNTNSKKPSQNGKT
jgi:hypothetical protein